MNPFKKKTKQSSLEDMKKEHAEVRKKMEDTDTQLEELLKRLGNMLDGVR